MLILLFFGLLAHAQNCPTPTYSTDLTESLQQAEGTFSDLDIPAFLAATDRLRAIIPCLRDPVTRSVTAEVHRFLGIRAMGDREPDAKLYFAAARSIEPYYEFPESLIPIGNPIRQVYADLQLGQGTSRDVPKPAVGYIQFDGRTTLKRPVTWPTFMQRFDDGGTVIESAYLKPESPMLKYEISTVIEIPDPEPYAPPPPPPPARQPLVLATAGAALTTVVVYGMAGSAEARFKSPKTPDNQLDAYEKKANTLVMISGLTGAATVGLGLGWATTF